MTARVASRDSGAVLIMALLIMSLVAALVVYLADSFELTSRRAGNRLASTQSLAYFMGAETIAIKVLRDDDNREVDHLNEDWASPQGLVFALEGYQQSDNFLRGLLEDAQGRFNVNTLADKADPAANAVEGTAKRFTEPQRRFIRLLQTFEGLEVSEAEAMQITEAVIDWLDADDAEFGLGGAESLFYSDLGYRPPNRAMTSVSELRQVRHITPELFELLRWVCVALPKTAALNVNTAPLNVMRTINLAESLSPLNETEGQELIDERGDGYQSTADLLATPLLDSLAANDGNISVEGMAVSSGYFLLHGEVNINYRNMTMNSLIRRTPDMLEVVWRSRGWL